MPNLLCPNTLLCRNMWGVWGTCHQPWCCRQRQTACQQYFGRKLASTTSFCRIVRRRCARHALCHLCLSCLCHLCLSCLCYLCLSCLLHLPQLPVLPSSCLCHLYLNCQCHLYLNCQCYLYPIACADRDYVVAEILEQVNAASKEIFHSTCTGQVHSSPHQPSSQV